MKPEFLKRNVHRVVYNMYVSLRRNMRITFPRRRQTRTRHFQDKCAIWSQWQNSTTRFQLGWKCSQLPHVQPCLEEERDSTAASKPIKNANNEASSLQEILATENTERATEENEPPALRSPRTRTKRRIIASFPSRRNDGRGSLGATAWHRSPRNFPFPWESCSKSWRPFMIYRFHGINLLRKAISLLVRWCLLSTNDVRRSHSLSCSSGGGGISRRVWFRLNYLLGVVWGMERFYDGFSLAVATRNETRCGWLPDPRGDKRCVTMCQLTWRVTRKFGN